MPATSETANEFSRAFLAVAYRKYFALHIVLNIGVIGALTAFHLRLFLSEAHQSVRSSPWFGIWHKFIMLEFPVQFFLFGSRIWLHSLRDTEKAQRIGAKIIFFRVIFGIVMWYSSELMMGLESGLFYQRDAEQIQGGAQAQTVFVTLSYGVNMASQLVQDPFHDRPWPHLHLWGYAFAFIFLWDGFRSATVRPIACILWACWTVGYFSMRAHLHALYKAHISEQRRMKAQEQLATYLFHELRNPLNAQAGAFDLLSEQARKALPLTPSTIAVLRDAQASAAHAQLVMDNMKDFTKLHAGQLELPDSCFTLDELLQGCAALERHQLRSQNGPSNPEAGPSNPEAVQLRALVDPRSVVGATATLIGPMYPLKQVLLNLLHNAIKYTDEGEVVLKVLAQPQAPTNRRGDVTLAFSVADTGCGVSPEDRARIFEPYQQGFRPGTGLGLPLCIELLRKMSSELELTDRPMGGSIFSFSVTCRVHKTE